MDGQANLNTTPVNNLVGTDPENIIQPRYSNTFRTGFTETDFWIDFGNIIPGNETEVISIDKVIIPTDRIVKLLLALYGSILEYEKQFNKDLGFGGNKESNEKND